MRRLIESGVGLAERFGHGDNPITIEEALANAIREWKPDVIHTLGFDSASYFYLRTRKQYALRRWPMGRAGAGPRYRPAEVFSGVRATHLRSVSNLRPLYR